MGDQGRSLNPETRGDMSRTKPSDRLKARETLYEPWDQLSLIFEAIDEKVYVADPVTHEILYANPAKKSSFGADIVGQKCHKAFQGLEAPCEFCTNPLIFGENLGKTHIWEFQNRKTGNWLRCIDRAIPWSDGRMVRFEMAIGIHDRKVAEEALRTSEQEYRSIVENLNEVIYTAEADGRFTYVSPVTESITGYTSSEIVGRFFTDFVLPDDLDHVRKRWAGVLSGQVKPSEFRIVKKSGKTLWARTFSKPVFKNGKGIGLHGVLLDITEYKETEAALRESEKRYRDLLETMNEGFSMVDEKGVITYANESFLVMVQGKAEEIIGSPVAELFNGEGRKVWAKEFEKRKKHDSTPYQMSFVRRDGEKVPTIISPRPIFEEKGRFRGSFAAITDVSHLKKIEKSLKEREKELKIKTTNLEEMNAALRVLLRRMEEDRRELEDKVKLNIEQMIQPYLERLKTAGLSERQKGHLNRLESNLNEIMSPFTHKLLMEYPRLTPSELQIANQIRQGKSSKEIADDLGLSLRTVETHRRNMRTKLGIKEKKTNLRSYLLTNQYT